MSAKLIDALSRSGVAHLYELAGKAAVDLLERAESKALTGRGLAEIVVDRLGPEEALREPRVCKLAIEALRQDEAEHLCAVLGLATNDPFLSLARIDFGRSETQFAVLHAFFGVAYEAKQAEGRPALTKLAPPYTLFSHQRRASLRVRQKLGAGRRRVLLHMPTGAGKTRTAVTTLVDVLRSELDRCIVVWLAHSEELCDQAFDEACRAWATLGSRELTVYRHYGDHRIRDFRQVSDGIIVAGLQLLYRDSLSRQGEVLDLSRRVRVIVMDEAHQATAPTYAHLIDLLQRNPTAGVLGLSATPGRSLRNVHADLALAEFFERQKVKLEVEGYNNPIDYLTAEGYLAKIEYVRLPFASRGEITLNEAEAARLREGFDLPNRVVEQLAADDMRNLLIIDTVAAEVAAGGKVILFALSVGHAGLIASVLRLRGIKAAAVTSSTPTERRRQIIQRYRDTSDLSVICNYGVLTTGFDAPKTNVAVIARPTTSVVLYSQMVGRAARGTRAGGNARCRVLTIVDQVPGFRSLVEGFEFWDDIWEEK